MLVSGPFTVKSVALEPFHHNVGAAKLPLVIIDARPKVNAQVNQAAGKGFELSKFYANTEVREGSAGPRRSAQRRRVLYAAEAGKRGEREGSARGARGERERN